MKTLLLSVLLFFCLAPLAQAATIGRPMNSLGLIGYWPFDGAYTNWSTGTTNDISGNGNTGSLVGFATTSSLVAGKRGQAISFSAGKYIDLGSNALIAGATNNNYFSIGAWIYVTGFDTQDPIYGEYNSGTTDTKNYFFVDGTTHKVRFDQFLPGGGTFDSATAINTNTWYFVTYVQNGTSRNMYINGSLDKSDTSPETYSGAVPDQVRIGRRGGSSANYQFTGNIDDVRVYNRALSATEVAALYNQGSARVGTANNVLTNGLVGHWTFDGYQTNWSTGTTNDISGGGNTGTLAGFSTTSSPVAGKLGQALNFDGAGSVISVSSTNLALDTGTLVAWIKTTNPGSGFRGIYSQSSGAGIYLYNNAFATYDNGGAAVRTTGVSLNDGKWHQVAMSFDSGVTSGTLLYIDGALKLTTTITNTGHSATRIGEGQGGAPQIFNGAIDDVRVYNRILSPAEIKALAGAGQSTVGHSSVTGGISSNGLAGYWPLDGNTINWATGAVTDVSGNNTAGQLSSMSTSSSPTQGKIGQALKFSGGNVLVASSEILSGQAAYTICAWVTTTSAARSGGRAIYAERAPSSNDIVKLEGNDTLTAGKAQFTIRNDGGTLLQVKGTTNIGDGKWHFECGTLSGTAATLYVDGAVDASGTWSGTNTYTGSITSQIGDDPVDTGAQWLGNIDDVRIYTRALSQSEIQALYRATR